jgi:hypothetical protein
MSLTVNHMTFQFINYFYFMYEIIITTMIYVDLLASLGSGSSSSANAAPPQPQLAGGHYGQLPKNPAGCKNLHVCRFC